MDIKTLLGSTQSLITLPEAYLRIRDMIEQPEVSLTEIGYVVELDPNLSARVLRLVNSAAYGIPGRVDSIDRAIKLVGLRELQLIVLAASAAKTFADIDSSLADMHSFWHHGVFTALAAKFLAYQRRLAHSDRLFTAGLLHDIGQLPMYFHMPAQSQTLLRRLDAAQKEPQEESTIPLRIRLEREIFGYDHAQVSAGLLRAWRLPESLCQPIEHHHTPSQTTEYPVETAVLHIAQQMGEHYEPSLPTRQVVPGASGKVEIGAVNWWMSGLGEADIPPALNEVNNQFFEIFELIAPASTLVV